MLKWYKKWLILPIGVMMQQYKVRIFAFLEEKICNSQAEISNYHDEMGKKYANKEIETHVKEVY